jgi:hypothetical protein
MASFRDLPKLPNITQTYFLKGVCFLNKNKSTADKCKSTGGAGAKGTFRTANNDNSDCVNVAAGKVGRTAVTATTGLADSIHQTGAAFEVGVPVL